MGASTVMNGLMLSCGSGSSLTGLDWFPKVVIVLSKTAKTTDFLYFIAAHFSHHGAPEPADPGSRLTSFQNTDVNRSLSFPLIFNFLF